MAADTAIITMEGEYETAHKLLNGISFNDLGGPQTQISRSGHSVTLNISKMAADTAIVAMEG